jgi:exopolyphosphatase/guanosine-5'-triphosphate,3'-diphosphate pyrophosphatase
VDGGGAGGAAHGPQNPSYSTDAVAALELGADSALLLIARPAAHGGLEVLEEHDIGTGLAAGWTPGTDLSRGRLERAAEVLATYVRRMQLAGVRPERVRIAATAVLRAASNGAEAAGWLGAGCGFGIGTLTARDEGRLVHLGRVAAGDPPHTTVLDLAGASTQWVGPQAREVWSVGAGALLGFGALGGPGLGPEPWEAQAAAVYREAFPAAGSTTPVVLGSTARNLACLLRGAETFDPRLADGVPVSPDEARRWGRKLFALPAEERLDLGVEPNRAEHLAAGCLALAAALEAVGASGGLIRATGLRHGMVELLLRGVGPPVPGLR